MIFLHDTSKSICHLFFCNVTFQIRKELHDKRLTISYGGRFTFKSFASASFSAPVFSFRTNSLIGEVPYSKRLSPSSVVFLLSGERDIIIGLAFVCLRKRIKEWKLSPCTLR
eukprot:TRINITY_DN2299_c0_g1_i4.p1 TRINITY_DN2299_c0_g1~~TRINITY_DN2299_c0_g1_i4.p1  ORF type:complete len:112 (+),score=4.17 TRINITY_DN2299_c0_g1_i4:510-845(+)